MPTAADPWLQRAGILRDAILQIPQIATDAVVVEPYILLLLDNVNLFNPAEVVPASPANTQGTLKLTRPCILQGAYCPSMALCSTMMIHSIPLINMPNLILLIYLSCASMKKSGSFSAVHCHAGNASNGSSSSTTASAGQPPTLSLAGQQHVLSIEVPPGVAAAYQATTRQAVLSNTSSPGSSHDAPFIPALLTFRDLVLDNLPTGPATSYPAGLSVLLGWSFAGLNR